MPLAILDAAATRAAHADGAVALDARDPDAFLYNHLRGALFAPPDGRTDAVLNGYLPDGASVVLVGSEEQTETLRERLPEGTDVRGTVSQEVMDALFAEERWAGDGAIVQGIKSILFQEVDTRRHYTNTTVVDVRKQDEWDEAHIPGAVHAPYSELPGHVVELPKEDTLLVHCGSGKRAAVAAAYLQARGFHVAHVDDLFTAWQKLDAKKRAEREGAAA
jgi:hydroxyacylglutathione hydrolase